MNLEGIILAEISQAEKDIPNDFTYSWDITKQNRMNSGRFTDAESD